MKSEPEEAYKRNLRRKMWEASQEWHRKRGLEPPPMPKDLSD